MDFNGVVGLVGIALFLVLLTLGVHIGVTLLFVGLAGTSLVLGFSASSSMTATTAFYFTTMYPMVVVPLFILMGLIGGAGGMADDAYRGILKWTAGLRAGPALATVLANAVFGTVTGSSVAAATVFARMASPQIRRSGFSPEFAYGLTATAGIIGMLIPPSALAVIYGVLTRESIGQLLIAGIGPGLLLTLSLSITVLIFVALHPDAGLRSDSAPRPDWLARIRAIGEVWPVLVIATTIIGGIYTGVFTATEAAAVATFVILLVGTVTRRLNVRQVATTLAEGIGISAMIFLIFVGAQVFGRFLVVTGITPLAMNLLLDLQLPPFALVILLAVILLIMGCFLDSISILAVTLPIVHPVIQKMGVDTLWFAMVVILAIEIGVVTPPVGLNVYAVKGVAEKDVTLEMIFRGILPFYAALLVTLVLTIAFPALSTWLPRRP